MDYRAFDINVECLEGLNSENMLFNKRVYAVVSVVGRCRSVQKTPFGKFEAKYKRWEWDYPMRFHVQESMVENNLLTVVIKLRRNTRCFCRDKDIGEVYIPIKQLFCTIDGRHNSGFGAYQVHSPSGKPRGYLKLSYKFNESSSRSASAENLFNNQSQSRALASSSSSARSSSEVACQYQFLSSAPSYSQYHVLPSAPPL